MILVDTNLLVYAYVASMPQHQRSREWLDAHINGMARVAMPWPSLLGFVRLVTNPRIFDRPSAMSAAWRQVESWLAGDTVWIPLPTDRHREVLAALIPAAEGRANLVPDAHLAALAIEHGLTLCSADGDFARFEGLAWENPLA